MQFATKLIAFAQLHKQRAPRVTRREGGEGGGESDQWRETKRISAEPNGISFRIATKTKIKYKDKDFGVNYGHLAARGIQIKHNAALLYSLKFLIEFLIEK